MKEVTLAALHEDLFQLIDEVLKTGESLAIVGDGGKRILTVVAHEQASKGVDLSKLVTRAAVCGDPDTLAEESVAEWDPDRALAPDQA